MPPKGKKYQGRTIDPSVIGFFNTWDEWGNEATSERPHENQIYLKACKECVGGGMSVNLEAYQRDHTSLRTSSPLFQVG